MVCADILMEGWLLVSCSCSSSSIQEVMKELSAAEDEGRDWLQEEEKRNGQKTAPWSGSDPTGQVCALPVHVQVEWAQ